jgi:hypothetical protein
MYLLCATYTKVNTTGGIHEKPGFIGISIGEHKEKSDMGRREIGLGFRQAWASEFCSRVLKMTTISTIIDEIVINLDAWNHGCALVAGCLPELRSCLLTRGPCREANSATGLA